jgi:hypothetical protein
MTRDELEQELETEMRSKTAELQRLTGTKIGQSIYRMFPRYGAIETLRRVVKRGTGSEGFQRLREIDRLDLSVEHTAIDLRYRGIVDDATLARAEASLSAIE